MVAALCISLVVVAYNAVANRWRPFHGTLYVPLNLAFTGVVTVAAMKVSDLSSRDLGISGSGASVALTLLLVAVFAAGAFGIALSPFAGRIADERVAGRVGARLAYYALVRVPFGTALAEEVVFRGVLFALWREAGAIDLCAAALSSVAFGLWHIVPTAVTVRMNDAAASRAKVVTSVVGAVLATTVVGLGFTWLRVWGGGLLGPILLHAGVNSIGVLAASLARRRGG